MAPAAARKTKSQSAAFASLRDVARPPVKRAHRPISAANDASAPSLKENLERFLERARTRISPKLGLPIGCAAVYALVSCVILATAYKPAVDVAASESVPMTTPSGSVTRGIRVTIGYNDTLRGVLASAGVSLRDIDEISRQVQAIVPAGLAPGATIDLSPNPRQGAALGNIANATIRARLDLAIDISRSNGHLTATPRDIDVYQTPVRVYGHVTSDLFSSLEAAGVPAIIAQDYIKVLAPHLSAGSVKRGDAFDLVIDQHRTAKGEVSTGKLMYVGLYQTNGSDLELSQWTKDGQLKWYEAGRVGSSSDTLQRPVPGDVTSSYGERFHPILGYNRMHRGVDFHAAPGTPILAVQTGWVERAGWAGAFGKQVALQHGANFETTYSHMSAVAVRPGELVQQGQVVGYVGATGLATGAHLHFEVHHNGEAINPASVPFHTRPQLAGADLAGYQKRLHALLAVPVGLTNIKG